MSSESKKDAETSTSDLNIDIIEDNLDNFTLFMERLSTLQSKFSDIEDIINIVISENEKTMNELKDWLNNIMEKSRIESENKIMHIENMRMEERFELLEKNNKIKLKMKIQELEMNTKLEEIKNKYNYLNIESKSDKVENLSNNNQINFTFIK